MRQHWRRAFVEALVSAPFGGVALSGQTPSEPVVKVAAGSGRANDITPQGAGQLAHRLYGIVNVGPPLKL